MGNPLAGTGVNANGWTVLVVALSLMLLLVPSWLSGGLDRVSVSICTWLGICCEQGGGFQAASSAELDSRLSGLLSSAMSVWGGFFLNFRLSAWSVLVGGKLVSSVVCTECLDSSPPGVAIGCNITWAGEIGGVGRVGRPRICCV
jgi:hypothetical protein